MELRYNKEKERRPRAYHEKLWKTPDYSAINTSSYTLS
jgi:hypothetical protein